MITTTPRQWIAASLFAVVGLLTQPHASGSLIALYDFEGDVTDSGGSALDGTVTGTTAFSGTVPAAISGRSSQAFDFDGSSFVSLPHAGIDLFSRAQATGASVSLWVRAATQDENYFFSEGNTGTNTPIYGVQTGDTGAGTGDRFRFAHRTDAGSLTLEPSNTSYLTGSPAYHHVVFTDNAGDLNIYVDGVADTADFDYTPGVTSMDLTTIGALDRLSTCCHFTGQIDEVAIYDEVLNQQQVNLLASGAPPATVTPRSPLPAIAGGDAIAVDFSDEGGSAANFNVIDSNTNIPAGNVVRYSDGALVDGVSLTFTGASGFNNDTNADGWTGQAADPYYEEDANDLTFAINTGAPLKLTFGGLDDELRYNVRLYALFGRSDALGRTETFTVTNGTGTLSTTLDRATRWFASTLEAGGTVFQGVRTDGSGNIVVSAAGANFDNPLLNAVVLEVIGIPEPSTILLLGLGSVIAVRRRCA